MDRKYINDEVNISEDFFGYATGKWIDENPQPDEYPSWGTFSALREDVLGKLRRIIDNLPNDSDDVMIRKMKEFYDIYTNYEKRNSEGYGALKPYVEEIRECRSKDELLELCIRDFGIEMFVGTGLRVDDKNSENYEVHMGQELLLGNKDYYLSSDKDIKAIMEKYIEVSKKIYVMCGFSEDYADEKVRKFFECEKELAKYAYSMEELDDVEKNYHMMPVDEVSETIADGKMDIRRYLSWFGMNETEQVQVCQPLPVKKGFEMIDKLSLEDLKDIAEFLLIDDYADDLGDEFRKVCFEFTKFFSGAKDMSPKWKLETEQMNSTFRDDMGKIFSSRFFDITDKRYIEQMIDDIKESYAEIISEQDWMSDETKEIALDKLASMKCKIGFPNKWKKYLDMPVDGELTYIDNCILLGQYFHKRYLNDYYNQKVDHEEWAMSPQTVNACYNPSENDITFPAGILQPPFYDRNGSDADNYGAIGVVIGHEITHGFDTNGRLYTKEGNMEDWWTESDAEEFKKRTQNTIDRFDSMSVCDGKLKCNGKLTLNENIADFGGLKIAYNALKKAIERNGGDVDDNEWKRTFFLSYAQVWSGVDTEECLRDKIMNDVHSVKSIRVNGTLPMMDEWYEAFGIDEDSPLFVEENKRAQVW